MLRERPPVKRFDQRVLEFVKEWSGVATVLIAILYTFPFDLIGRVKSWREHDVVAARAALTQLEELAANRILAIKQVKDDNDVNESQFLANTFNIRTYNIMTTDRDIFKKAIGKLSSSELYAIASNFALSSLVGDALPFYRASIEKSKDIDLPAYATANRELGQALSFNTKNQDIEGSREAYIRTLTVIANKENRLDPTNYAIDLAELAYVELTLGDWKCGTDEHVMAHNVFDRLILTAPLLTDIQKHFDDAAAAVTKRETQPAEGCGGLYAIPKIDWL